MILAGTHDTVLVVLSILVAIVASYAALDLAGRVRVSTGAAQVGWLGTAAAAMGGGIWSMHFVAMLAFSMPGMEVDYDVGLTLLSLAVAILAAGAGFLIVAKAPRRPSTLLVAGGVTGSGVAGMHYMGMAAMRMPAALEYDRSWVVVSLLIAVGAATVALYLAGRDNRLLERLAAALVMGVAVAGMHYAAMRGSVFHMAPDVGMAHGLASLGQAKLAMGIAASTFLILFLALVAAMFDRRYAEAQSRLQSDLSGAYAELQTLNAELEQRVHRQTRDIRMITDALPVLIAFVDGQERYGFANLAYEDWFGLAPEAIVGRTIREVAGEDFYARRSALIARALAGEECHFEVSWPRLDGRARIAEIRYLPRRTATEDIEGFYVFVLDITERVGASEALREQVRHAERLAVELEQRTVDAEAANRAKSTFIANMSHELRTPLSAIIGYAELLAEEIADDAKPGDLRPDVARIESSARHLLGIINDVLDLSKVESGKMEAFAETFDVAALVADVASGVAPLVERKKNRLAVDAGHGLGTMHTDAVKLRQILLNLLSNAAKFTEDGDIHLTVTREPGDRMRFTVTDTGIGMTEAQVAKLFRRFQQADASTTRQFGGTGLGLALSRAFAAMLGGEVAVTSREGLGSTFTVVLPTRLPEIAELGWRDLPQSRSAA